MGQFIKKFDPVILLLILISETVVTIWFKNGYLFQGAEEGTPFYNLTRASQLFSSTWIDQYLGSPFLPDTTKIPIFNFMSDLQSFGLPSFFIQALLFIFILSIGSISVYFLLKTLLKVNKLFAGLGAFFYLCNPYSISEIWSRGLYHQFFAYALIPFFLLMFVFFVEYRRFSYLSVGVIFSYIFSAAMGNPAYLVTLWFPVISYFIFCMFNPKIKNANFLIYGLVYYVIAWSLVNLWWLGVVIPFSASAYTGNGSVFENSLDSLKAISTQLPFTNVIRLFHEIRFGKDFYGDFYTNPAIILLSFIYPVIALMSLIRLKQKNLGFFVFVFTIGLFVSLGSNPPFGEIFIYFFNHITPLQVFRNPYEKFGIDYLLGFTGLFVLGIKNTWEFLNTRSNSLKVKYGIICLLFIMNGIFCWSFWTGSVIGWGTVTKVPYYYDQLNRWLDKADNSHKTVFFLPFMADFGAEYHWDGSSYHGTDPLFQVFDRPVISQSGHSAYLNALKRYQGSLDLTTALAMIRVKYIVGRNDLVFAGEEDKQNPAFVSEFFQPNLSNGPDLCNNKYVKTETGIECIFSGNLKNLVGVRYIHILINTNITENLDLIITDKFYKKTKWSEKNLFFDLGGEFLKSNQRLVTFYLNDPSENSFIDLHQIDKIKIDFKHQDLAKLNEFEIIKIIADDGNSKSISGVKFVDKIGGMSIYEVSTPDPLKEVNVVNNLLHVASYLEMFQQAPKTAIDSTSFIISNQNINKKPLLDKYETSNIVSIKKGNLLYFIESANLKDYLIQLNTSYNSEWKVVPIESINLTDGSILNNIKLLFSVNLNENDHYLSNGYANLWHIKGNTKIALLYRPQIVLNILLPISKFFLSTIIIVFLGRIAFKFYKKLRFEKN